MKSSIRKRVEDYLRHGSTGAELRKICEDWCSPRIKKGVRRSAKAWCATKPREGYP